MEYLWCPCTLESENSAARIVFGDTCLTELQIIVKDSSYSCKLNRAAVIEIFLEIVTTYMDGDELHPNNSVIKRNRENFRNK